MITYPMGSFLATTLVISIIPNSEIILSEVENKYQEGLKYCLNPKDPAIAISEALKSLKLMIVKETNWTMMLRGLFTIISNLI